MKTIRTAVITGVLGLVVIFSGCGVGAEEEPQTQAKPAVQTKSDEQGLRWDCTDNGYTCCQGVRCCAWSPVNGWLCE